MSKKMYSLSQLSKWYLNRIAPSVKLMDMNYVSNFTKASTPADKAELLLFENKPMPRGCHQWYLKSARLASGNQAKLQIESKKLWNGVSTVHDFEGLYNWVYNSLNTIPYISQLTIYDIAIRIAVLKRNPILFPQKNVYIHALSYTAFRWLIKKRYIVNLGNNSVINISLFYPVFGKSLDARMIEDLLCYIGKSLRRLKKNATSSNSIEGSLDTIVSKL